MTSFKMTGEISLQWGHNERDGVSNHEPHDCLLNRLFGRRSKETSKLRVTGLCAGNSPGPVNSPHKGPVKRKMFPFDDVIMEKPHQTARRGPPRYLVVRRAGLLWSQQDFEWRWSVPLFKCLTVLEFSFILFDLCLLITFFNFIMNYVPIVTFWIFTYHKIWILSIMFCSIWSYWIIYFLACLEVSWRVVS